MDVSRISSKQTSGGYVNVTNRSNTTWTALVLEIFNELLPKAGSWKLKIHNSFFVTTICDLVALVLLPYEKPFPLTISHLWRKLVNSLLVGYHNSWQTAVQHHEDDGRVVDGDRDSDDERMPENCYYVGCRLRLRLRSPGRQLQLRPHWQGGLQPEKQSHRL